MRPLCSRARHAVSRARSVYPGVRSVNVRRRASCLGLVVVFPVLGDEGSGSAVASAAGVVVVSVSADGAAAVSSVAASADGAVVASSVTARSVAVVLSLGMAYSILGADPPATPLGTA